VAYCSNCGTELQEGQRFCPGCGTAAETPQDAEAPPGTQRKKVVKVDRLDKVVGLILAVVIGVPLLLAVIWFVFQFILGFVAGLLA
jgi:uncharacterized membrane protein YvbJ